MKYSLEVFAKPELRGNQVFVDGVLVGTPPVTVTHLQAGSHMVEIRGGEKEGYKKIEAKDGDEKKITIRLKKIVISTVYVKGGCFLMGNSKNIVFEDEKPAHEVCVDSFFLSSKEVTRGLFGQFIKETGFKTDAEREGHCWGWDGDLNNRMRKNWKYLLFKQEKTHPVVCVSWKDSVQFTYWLSNKTGKKYRLPTEAEWEFAARERGKDLTYSGTSNPRELASFGNYCDFSCNAYSKNEKYNDGFKNTAPVASFKPNALGVYDMSGNVWEWCLDKYVKNFYNKSPKRNPKGEGKGLLRIVRGGSWLFGFDSQRTRRRSFYKSNFKSSDTGFRVVQAL